METYSPVQEYFSILGKAMVKMEKMSEMDCHNLLASLSLATPPHTPSQPSAMQNDCSPWNS